MSVSSASLSLNFFILSFPPCPSLFPFLLSLLASSPPLHFPFLSLSLFLLLSLSQGCENWIYYFRRSPFQCYIVEHCEIVDKETKVDIRCRSFGLEIDLTQMRKLKPGLLETSYVNRSMGLKYICCLFKLNLNIFLRGIRANFLGQPHIFPLQTS